MGFCVGKKTGKNYVKNWMAKIMATYIKLKRCPKCDGTGEAHNPTSSCSLCRGKGTVEVRISGLQKLVNEADARMEGGWAVARARELLEEELTGR